MSTKEFFKSVRREQKELERMAERVKEAESALLPQAIRYDMDRVQTSPTDPMIKGAEEIDRYTRILRKMYRRLLSRMARAAQMISTLQDTRHRQVLELYVLDGLTMIETADKMGYTPRAAYGFYSEALRILDKTFQ